MDVARVFVTSMGIPFGYQEPKSVPVHIPFPAARLTSQGAIRSVPLGIPANTSDNIGNADLPAGVPAA